MFRRGYMGTAVREVAARAQVPLGSYTNHFRSKETFTCDVLDRYYEHVTRLTSEALESPGLSPRQRLRRYLDLITDRLAADGFQRGCLIGDLSLEAAPQSERIRERLRAVFRDWRAPFSRCIADAQRRGEIAGEFSSDDLADFLLASWEGAILQMKVLRSAEPLERFKRIAFATLFKENTK